MLRAERDPVQRNRRTGVETATSRARRTIGTATIARTLVSAAKRRMTTSSPIKRNRTEFSTSSIIELAQALAPGRAEMLLVRWIGVARGEECRDRRTVAVRLLDGRFV